jgi:hypothetical protein
VSAKIPAPPWPGLLALWLVFASGCSADRPAVRGAVTFGPGEQDADGRYHNQGFSIQFPAGWETREDVPGLAVMGILPPEGPEDRFVENCVVAIEELGEEVALRAYKERALAQLRRTSQGFLLLQEADEHTFSGIAAKKLVYDQEIGEMELRLLVYLMVGEKRAYLVTCGTGQSAYNAYKKLFEQVAKSFQLETLR